MAPEIATRPTAVLRTATTEFGDLYGEHLQPLLRFAFLLCGHQQQAEDAVAETFVKVLPQWERGTVTQPAAYLRRTLVNELTSRGRRRILERREAARLSARRLTERAIDADTADRDVMMQALRQLPLGQRAVLVLRFYDDLSERDTADALGVSTGTVKSQTARALDRLRALLKEQH